MNFSIYGSLAARRRPSWTQQTAVRSRAARVLFRLGDTADGLGRRTLEAYAADPRRAYANHARLVLEGK